MIDRKENYFLKSVYNGSDGEDFKIDFVEYLKEILSKNDFRAMSDHQLFLGGGIQVIKEIIKELE